MAFSSGVDWGKLFVDAADMNELFRSQLEDEADAIFEEPEQLRDRTEPPAQRYRRGCSLCSIEQSEAF